MVAKGMAEHDIKADETLGPTPPTPEPIQITFEPSTDSAESPTSPSASTRVRFRSRVRIASGHRFSTRRSSSEAKVYGDHGCASLSSSPSSSISAPLRSRRGSDYDAGLSAWAPLGRRISLLAGERSGRKLNGTSPASSERAPLMSRSQLPVSYGANDYQDSDEEEEALYAEEVERLFGPFPRRLLNAHWWKWQLEPIYQCILCQRGSYDLD